MRLKWRKRLADFKSLIPDNVSSLTDKKKKHSKVQACLPACTNGNPSLGKWLYNSSEMLHTNNVVDNAPGLVWMPQGGLKKDIRLMSSGKTEGYLVHRLRRLRVGFVSWQSWEKDAVPWKKGGKKKTHPRRRCHSSFVRILQTRIHYDLDCDETNPLCCKRNREGDRFIAFEASPWDDPVRQGTTYQHGKEAVQIFRGFKSYAQLLHDFLGN